MSGGLALATMVLLGAGFLFWYYNALYGNPRAVPEVEAYLAEHCTLLGTFESPGYAMRIAALIGGPWRVSVYRVDSPAGS